MSSRWSYVLAVVACGHPATLPREGPTASFREIEVATVPGLSGLATDERGGLWSVAERDDLAYRIVLDDRLHPTIETVPIDDVPPNIDLEGIAVLGDGRFALGTEGREEGVATVLLAERRGPRLAVTRVIRLPASAIGIRLAANHGAEGVCNIGDTIIVAIEGAGEQDGRRWAPIVRIDGGEVVRSHRLWLTTGTGKISALDCRLAADGSTEVLAVERHFEVTKILRFTLPATAGDLTPTVLLDLGSELQSRLNIEGIAWTPRGIIAVVDNQWKIVTMPSRLLLFENGVIH
ncbi:MAG: esterase-like activity of phytase family protein [Myxococcota bacterium]|nr:esterase-like activity of phytase family protein [Myxococcota bacterium]